MTKRNTYRLLAIDPGTKYLGVAIFEGKELIYYATKTIPKLKTPRKTLRAGGKIIQRLIHDFKPKIMIVEKTFFPQSANSALLNTFTNRIQIVGKRKGLTVHTYAANTVRKYVCGNGSASKDEVAKVLISYYPELKAFLTSDKRWKELFHRNMFDAVALGLFYLHSNSGQDIAI